MGGAEYDDFGKLAYNKPHNIRNEVDEIRKVILTMNENQRYEIIKKVIETNGKKKVL